MKAINKIVILLGTLPLMWCATACVDDSDDDMTNDSIAVAFSNSWPEGFSADAVESAEVNFHELNTGATYTLNPLSNELGTVPAGVYDYDGTVVMTVSSGSSDGVQAPVSIKKTLRVSGTSITVTGPTSVPLAWFFANPEGSLVFSELYAAGSLNASGTNGLNDSYFLIYNNTDQTIYADGLGIAESAFVNARNSTFEILTEANDRQVNFTAGTIWVIPGNGTDVPIAPGKSLKIVDQAIDWSAQVPGALDHTDADFEWYDNNERDTDNPSVPNLDKWYCYTNTIWVMSKMCNRSYALVRFPVGTTAETYLANYHGGYDYISLINTPMHNDKAYLIPNGWIVDGVNLGNGETYVYGALGSSVDISYASVSDVDRDPNRYGKKFLRKIATKAADGRVIYQDTNDSAADFTLVPAR